MSIVDRLFQSKQELSNKNLQEGQAFLEANKNQEGVVCLPSGAQYLIVKDAEGAKPSATDKVTCHYHGVLINGTVFDSSVQRGQPATFPLNMVIKGWTEVVQLMSVGSKWRLFLPANLAYGDRHVSAEIGPNSTLVFEVELLGIN
ncbi:MAG: FKBP-type peptidyl-prolyl cis-trans isomerase [Phycisphaerales bacterium]|nr:FKBP-type peptidyl-prolyl cis-trans isomerase [Phycisphaerales bacterium]